MKFKLALFVYILDYLRIMFCNFFRYILNSVGNICKDLDHQKEESKQKIKTIEEQISYWKKGVKESEENIRDMVSQRREK